MPLDRFTLVNQNPTVDGPVRAELVALGAALEELLVTDRDGNLGNVTLRLDHDDDRYDPIRNPYLGVTVGRYANRLAGAQFTLDGVTHQLHANEGPNLLHGGDHGLGRQLWSGTQTAADTVQFTLVSPDGEMGFPGEQTTTVSYHLSGASLRLDLTATTTKPTICSLTNHTYWNLAEQQPTIDDHLITINADTVIPVDEALIPSGAPEPVSDDLDFRTRRRIGDRTPPRTKTGYDHCLMINGSGFRHHARVENPTSGRILDVWSDHPAIQFYTGVHLPGTHGGGRDHCPFAGLALEPQHPPDAPHQEWAHSPELRPGQQYHHRIEYRFSTDASPTAREYL
jgi:aldose 1-epimerase